VKPASPFPFPDVNTDLNTESALLSLSSAVWGVFTKRFQVTPVSLWGSVVADPADGTGSSPSNLRATPVRFEPFITEILSATHF